MNYFLVKATYLHDNGSKLAKVTDELLIDALSFTEAEAKATREWEGHKDLLISGISRSKITEFHPGESETNFFVQVRFVNEEGKKQKAQMLVSASDDHECSNRMADHLSTWVVDDVEVTVIKLTKISKVIGGEDED